MRPFYNNQGDIVTWVMNDAETIQAIKSVAIEGIEADGNNDLMYNALLEIASLCGADIVYNYRHKDR